MHATSDHSSHVLAKFAHGVSARGATRIAGVRAASTGATVRSHGASGRPTWR